MGLPSAGHTATTVSICGTCGDERLTLCSKGLHYLGDAGSNSMAVWAGLTHTYLIQGMRSPSGLQLLSAAPLIHLYRFRSVLLVVAAARRSAAAVAAVVPAVAAAVLYALQPP
jgi:hypothetical protein